MGKNKMIAKSCPKCELQVAVASKSCKCGHAFFKSRRVSEPVQVAEDVRRRTGRVRRSQPQFYDSQFYDQKQSKRSPKKRSLSRSLEDSDYKEKKTESESAQARRRRALKRRALKQAQLEKEWAQIRQGRDKSRDPTPQLRPAQIARCSLILNEINRKMGTVTWQPPE